MGQGRQSRCFGYAARPHPRANTPGLFSQTPSTPHAPRRNIIVAYNVVVRPEVVSAKRAVCSGEGTVGRCGARSGAPAVSCLAGSSSTPFLCQHTCHCALLAFNCLPRLLPRQPFGVYFSPAMSLLWPSTVPVKSESIMPAVWPWSTLMLYLHPHEVVVAPSAHARHHRDTPCSFQRHTPHPAAVPPQQPPVGAGYRAAAAEEYAKLLPTHCCPAPSSDR